MNSKIKVAAYCRVSTDMEDQLHSLNAQIKYFTEYISDHVGWELIEVYYEMKIAKMIQFENMNPLKKAKNKGFWHIQCCRKPLFFVP